MNPFYFTLLILFVLYLPARINSDTLLHVNFDTHYTGPYTLELAKTDFPGADWYAGMNENRGEIVFADNSMKNVLKVKYPQGCVGPNECAVQVKAFLLKEVDTALVSYNIKFDSNFEFVKGGKLPGLCGKDCITGGGSSDGTNGWNARLMWRADGNVVQYVYYPDMNDPNHPGYGEDMPWTGFVSQNKFIPDKWHKVSTMIIMNTPGVKNGIIRSWFDGELCLNRTDISFRTVSTVKIDKFYISTFYGGSDESWAPGKDAFIYFDDFLVTNDTSINTLTKSFKSYIRNTNFDYKNKEFHAFTIDGRVIAKNIKSSKVNSSGVYLLVDISNSMIFKRASIDKY